MKMFCATTREIDEADIAVSEILEQLDLPKNQLKNSVGLIAMFGEFYDTGVYSAIVNALPFPCIGYSPSFFGSNGESGDMLLSVMIMTSDENEFDVFKLDYVKTLNETEISKTREHIAKTAAEIFSKGRPSLILPYWVLNSDVSSDDMLSLVDEYFEQVPLYGSVLFSSAAGHFLGFSCIGDGKKLENEAIFIAVYGELKPNFMVVSGVNETVTLHNSVKVTKSESNTLYEVNNIPMTEYLHSIGVLDSSFNSESLWVLPALLEDKERGITKVRAFMGISQHCPTAFYASGNIETGSTVYFGQLDSEATNKSARDAFEKLANIGADCFLGISCIARAWSNGTQYLKEFYDVAEIYEKHKAETGKELSYQIINSGGEICPVKDKNGNWVNTLHNYSLAICYFTDTDA
ncbi:MAG: hypothetical protein LBL93_02990 [Ruminococcus sp.]|jgi:hypothetical protein|nr:hypothetical protein [Ruminococcus sp.]